MWKNAKRWWGDYDIFYLQYFVQGLLGAFLLTTQLYYLFEVLGKGKEFSTSTAGMYLGLVWLPWAVFKLLISPIFDKWAARQASSNLAVRCFYWIAVATIVMAAGLVSITQSDTVDAMMWSAFVINFARAIQDIATDALCVYLLPKAKRAAMQWSSSLVSDVGAVIGGAGFIALIAVFGWVELILVLTLVVLCLGLIWPWRLIKSKRVLLDDESKMAPAWGKEVMTLFRWGPAMAVLLALTAHVCDGGFSPLVWTWMGKNLGYSANGMWMLVLFSSLFKPVGSALAGFLVEKTQRKAAIGVSLLGKAFSYVVLGGLVSYWGSQVLVYLLVMFTAIFEAATVSTMRAYFIDLTKRSAAATQFSVYMAATNGSAAIAGLLGGVVGELFSMDQALVFLGLLQLIALIPLVALYFLEAKE